MRNVLPYTIWMPRIDTAHAVPIPSHPTDEIVVTTPRIPGLELRIPPHAWIRDHEGNPVTEVSITPIPVDRPPFPLPPNVDVPVYFTIQPGGAYVSSDIGHGARLIYPNTRGDQPGARSNFWNYEPSERGWHVYGLGSVSAGRQVVPDPGVEIYEFSGAMINGPDAPGAPGFTPAGAPDGDPVDLGTGVFSLQKTDLYLPDVLPVALTRTYYVGDVNGRPFGLGMTHPYAMFLWSANQYQEADLILPDGGRIHYVRTSPGTLFVDAEFEHTATPTRFYKSRLVWSPVLRGWDLTLKDGTLYHFGENAPLQFIRDRHGNTITISRPYATGNITKITSPNGRWIEFTYAGSRITQAKDNSGRTVSYTYDASGRLWKVTDPAGGVTEYTYDASHRMLTIKDARGITYLTNEYDANNRVTRQTQADGTTFQFAYTLDANGKVTQTDLTNPRGFVRRLTFNGAGYPLTDTRAYGTAVAQTRSYTRQPGSNLVTSMTDALGRRTDSAHDTTGNLVTITRLAGTPDAVTTSYTYEPAFNQMATVTDPLNHTTSLEAPGAGDGTTYQFAYTTDGAAGPVLQSDVTNPRGFVRRLTFDGLRHLRLRLSAQTDRE